MLATVSLVTVGVLGVLVVGLLVVRLLVELRRLEAQVTRTRADLEPRYLALRELSERARKDAR